MTSSAAGCALTRLRKAKMKARRYEKPITVATPGRWVRRFMPATLSEGEEGCEGMTGEGKELIERVLTSCD